MALWKQKEYSLAISILSELKKIDYQDSAEQWLACELEQIDSFIEQGSYQKDGKTVYTSDFIVDSLEKLSSKKDAESKEDYGFVNIEADGLNDEGLPFN